MAAGPGERLRAAAATIRDDPSGPHAQVHALGWATVELDRAARELAADLGFRVDAFAAAADSVALGARCRVAHGTLPGGLALVILEPATEGVLAAALARDDEGPVAAWFVVEGGDAADPARSTASPGPFGPERTVPRHPDGGLRRFLIDAEPGTIRA